MYTDAWAKAALWAVIILSLLGLGIVAAFVFLDIDYITPDYNIKFLVVGLLWPMPALASC